MDEIPEEEAQDRQDEQQSQKPINVKYVIRRKRRGFGKQPQFVVDNTRFDYNEYPKKFLRAGFEKELSIDKAIQCSVPIANTAVNTNMIEFRNKGIDHTFGAYPIGIKGSNVKQVNLYKKQQAKKYRCLTTMPTLIEELERTIMMNAAIDPYASLFNQDEESYFKSPQDLKSPVTTPVVAEIRDFSHQERSVSHITWSHDFGRIGVAYCPLEYDPSLRFMKSEAYFFEVEIPSRPEGLIRSPSPLTSIEYHHKDIHSILGALFNGQVALWDNRVGPIPQGICSYDVAHMDVATNIHWINSKTGTEFFSGGLDGQIIWWDERNLSKALDSTWLDPEKGQCRPEMAIGCSALEYESSIPTKFVAGTQRGDVMLMMKKAKTPNDRLIHLFPNHHGSVKNIQRNPAFPKNIMSVGEDNIRITAEDCKESSIMWTAPQHVPYTYGVWHPSRPSMIIATRKDGILDMWDILRHPVKPIMSRIVSKEMLTTVCTSETGKHIAVGTSKGKVKICKMPDYLCEFHKDDKPELSAIFERESRREKFLEQRNRELRLRRRDIDKADADKHRAEEGRQAMLQQVQKSVAPSRVRVDIAQSKDITVAYETLTDPVMIAEREFFQTIDSEKLTKGLDAFAGMILEDEEDEEEDEGEYDDDDDDEDEEHARLVTGEEGGRYESDADELLRVIEENYRREEHDSETPNSSAEARQVRFQEPSTVESEIEDETDAEEDEGEGEATDRE